MTVDGMAPIGEVSASIDDILAAHAGLSETLSGEKR